jgi:hypothetical protein
MAMRQGTNDRNRAHAAVEKQLSEIEQEWVDAARNAKPDFLEQT